MTNYFKFQRKRIWLNLDEDAVEASAGFRLESPASHPHVIMEARPTFGARQFVRSMGKALTEARQQAQADVDRESIRQFVGQFSDEERAERMESHGVKSTAALVDSISDNMAFSAASVQLAAGRVMACRVAVGIRAIGGDFTCYETPWPDSPEWPSLDDDGGLERRMELISRFSGADVARFNALADGAMEVDEDEAGK